MTLDASLGLPAGRPSPVPWSMRVRAGHGLRRAAQGLCSDTLVLSAAGALVSVALTGFVLGASNNLFHLPIVAGLADEPQFGADAFVQSLRFFASGIWLLLRGSAAQVDPYWLFLALHVLSRFLTILGLLLCAGQLGIRGRNQKILFTALVCLAPMLRGVSYAGAGGLFLNVFTHSEIANGLSLLMIWCLVTGRITAGLALNGLVFFVNAFVAVWNAVPIALICGYGLATGRLDRAGLVRSAALGLALAAVPVLPVVLNVLANPSFGRPAGFDYPTFLRDFYPHHFLIGEVPAGQLVSVAALLLLANLSLWRLRSRSAPFLAALWGYMAVYALGMVVPLLTSSPAVLNLHLLRVSTVFHLLAALGSLALLTRMLHRRMPLHARATALLLFCLLCTLRPLTLLAPLLLLPRRPPRLWLDLFRRRVPARAAGAAGLAALACAAALIGGLTLKGWAHNRRVAQVAAEWEALGRWARSGTAPDAIFLVPVIGAPDLAEVLRDVPREIQEAGTSRFEYASHRRVWVDFGRGAAVMWHPGYHAEWRSRTRAVAALRTLPERRAYATANGIAYVVERCAGESPPDILFRTRSFCILPGAGSG
ncbi:hypothetical protein [Methylobacterium radiodurans]|uniref:Glycosyltransferase RgtA/B/C/D-like domain-containing protein n=1 Tax=Methylobacterium radiodurans TaxID=2202828 RepID=A0A2U8VQD0_9HYPH|nr:hypothetical protein [Methylobacterium radiodurans]AWN35835.1 hypothetical protein DK427_08810 [Methylobacterium radiodurans]